MSKEYKLNPHKKFKGRDRKREKVEQQLGPMTDRQWRDYQLMLHKNNKK